MHHPKRSRPSTRLPKLGAILALAASAPACLGGEEIFLTTSTAASSPESEGDSSDTDSLLITGAVALGLTVVATLVVVTSDDGGDFSYLREHQQEVRVAIARGDGPFVSDLGQRLGLPSPLLPHLGDVLQAARPALEPPLARGAVDEERARVFSRELVRALHDDPLLAPYLDDTLVIATAAHAG